MSIGTPQFICTISLALFTQAPPPSGPHQAPPKTANEPAAVEREPEKQLDMRVVHLQYTASVEIADILHRIYPKLSVTPDSQTNSLILMAGLDDQTAIAKLLQELDIPSKTEAGGGRDMRPIQLRNRSADDIAQRLTSLLSRRDGEARVAADKARGKLLLRGSTSFIDFAMAVVKELDVPAQTVQIDFAFLAADQFDTGPTQNIPEDLADVAKELKRFGRLSLIGRLSTTGVEDEPFKIEGMLSGGLVAQITGQLAKAVQDGSVQIMIDANASLQRNKPAANEPAAGAPAPTLEHSGFKISTTIVSRRGETVVIGSAPAGWKPGESAILVMQIRK